MTDVMKLKRERQKLIDEMRSITKAAETRDDKKMTETEGARWLELNAQVDVMKTEIERAEKMNQLELEGKPETGSEDRKEPDDKPEENRFESFGDFLSSVRTACIPGGKIDNRLVDIRSASGQSEVNPADGGFLVGTDQSTEILKRTYELAALASRCRTIPISANANGLKINAIDESSRATGSRWGGIRGYWAAEASTVTESKFKLRKVNIDLEKLMAFVYMTDEILEDATAMQGLCQQAVSEEFGWLLDEAIINGLGSGQPLGYMNSDALVSVSKETGQPAATIVYENIVKMWARMWARSRGNAAWFINQDCEPQLYTMALVVGAGGVPVYMPATSASPVPLLMGRPVISIEQAKTLGTTGDITLADLSQYLLIDKGGMKQNASIHVRFMYDEQVFRFTYRVNGQPMWNKPLTPANGTGNTLSPFVALNTRA